MEITGTQVRIYGTVQGVGYRPFVWRLATQMNLSGSVRNDGEGVLIQAWGSASQLANFISELKENAPRLARVEYIEVKELLGNCPQKEFAINSSQTGIALTNVSPDAATCADCLSEIFDPANRRYRYPFTNCTHCGPRFSIIRAIPYDRSNTSMQPFEMCAKCREEYRTPANRRFHAQPNACAVCGPRLWLENADHINMVVEPHEDAIALASAFLKQGKIVAIKGLGGFHLACDATNEQAVRTLRERKKRYEKPFALMASNCAQIANYAVLTEIEKSILTSSAAAIVLLQSSIQKHLAPSVAPGQTRLGFMLPYTPLHHLLLANWDTPLVMTSGNKSEAAQCITNEEAREQLSDIADYFLMHDRDIVHRLDDSVVQIMAGHPQVLRRGRGYAPASIPLPLGRENAPKVLALGGELKNTFCLTTDKKAVLSQYQGDLEDAMVFEAYRHSLNGYADLFQHAPAVIAIDQHPDYLSSKWGLQLAQQKNLPIVKVQHHHAHIAACLAEQGVAFNAAPVLGVVLDGLGWGADGDLWGGEFLLANYASCARLARFQPVRLPGAARAMKEPWRNAIASLHQAFAGESLENRYPELPFWQIIREKPIGQIVQMLEKGINSPFASSAGRLFDAVAALLGICTLNISYEGQAAILLQQHAESAMAVAKAYPTDIQFNAVEKLHEINWRPFWLAFLADLNAGTCSHVMAANFHKTLVSVLAAMIELLQTQHSFEVVVLSGGVMQNGLLVEELIRLLKHKGITALFPQQYPANDGALALGQAMIALAQTSS